MTTPKVTRLAPPPVHIFGRRVDIGRYALWTFPELAADRDGVRYLCWLCSQKWFSREWPLAYRDARALLAAALQAEIDADVGEAAGLV